MPQFCRFPRQCLLKRNKGVQGGSNLIELDVHDTPVYRNRKHHSVYRCLCFRILFQFDTSLFQFLSILCHVYVFYLYMYTYHISIFYIGPDLKGLGGWKVVTKKHTHLDHPRDFTR